MGALPLQHRRWNHNGTPLITASGLLSVDGAEVACGKEHKSSHGSLHCGAFCHRLKLKADSG